MFRRPQHALPPRILWDLSGLFMHSPPLVCYYCKQECCVSQAPIAECLRPRCNSVVAKIGGFPRNGGGKEVRFRQNTGSMVSWLDGSQLRLSDRSARSIEPSGGVLPPPKFSFDTGRKRWRWWGTSGHPRISSSDPAPFS